MKPPGPARNRQIAEMRHDQIAHEPIPGLLMEFHAKPYSTQISAAMILWDEMKVAGLCLKLTYDPDCTLPVSVTAAPDTWSMSSLSDNNWYHADIDEAAAISGAYIKWMESEGKG